MAGLLVGGIVALASVAAPEAAAQVVVVESRLTDRAIRAAERVLARGRYEVMDRDTVLGPEYRRPDDLIVHDADVRLEGEVAGSVVVVGGALFVRPTARIGGEVVVLRGLAIRSRLAPTVETIELPRDRRVRVVEQADTVRVVALGPPPVARVGLTELFGFRRVSYDRVNGATVSWGPQWRITGAEAGPLLDVWASVYSSRSDVGGGAELGVPLGGAIRLMAGAERLTPTNEWWARGDLANGAAALFFGRDVRDYYRADRAWLGLRRVHPEADFFGGWRFEPQLAVRASRDRSLDAREPWAIGGRADLGRLNQEVADSTIVSLEAGAELGWEGLTSRFRGAALLEHAPTGWGDIGFTHALIDARYGMEALWGHSLRVAAHARTNLGSRPAPPQRWSFLGGAATLPTLPVAALRGDRLVWLDSEYRIPLPIRELPVLGAPAIELLHATGTAWLSDESMPSWEQNLGAGLRLGPAALRVWIDPTISRPPATVLFEIGPR